MTRLITALILAAFVAGCGETEPAVAADVDAEAVPAHIDSVFPIEEELRRFRATLKPEPSELAGGRESRDALVSAYLDALSRSDTSELRMIAISREEFGYLYYPYTHYTSKPYELSPAIVWFQLENYGSRGLGRALRRFGGKSLDVIGYTCPSEPLTQGDNRIWADCVLERRDVDGSTSELSLFGPILERDGQFKLVSHANRLSSS